MSSFFKTGDLVKLLLLVAGTVLLLIGFIEVFIDFVTDWKISEYINIFVMLSGAAILLGTIFVYVIIPEYQSHQRLERLRQYYAGKPGGEARDIIHNIIERSQGIVGSVDVIADNVRDCAKEDVTYGACVEKIATSRELIDYINGQSNKLNDSLIQLEDYVKTKKQPATK